MSDVLVDNVTRIVGQKKSDNSPMVRFDGFTDDWEQRKLEDGVAKVGDGLHGTPSYNENGTVSFINGNNLVNGKIILTDQTKRVTEEQQSEHDKSLNENTILMSINGTIGNLAWYEGQKLMLGKSAAYIEVDTYNKKFMYQLLQTGKIKNYFLDNLTGTTIKNLGLKTIRQTPCLIPIDNEQSKIGLFLEKLDNTTALHQRKLDVSSNMKQTFLQKMFPEKGSSVPEIRLDGFTDDWEERKLGDVLSHEIKGKAQKDKLSNGFVEYLDANYLNGSDPILCDSDIDVEYGDILVLWDGSKAGTVYNGFRGVLGSTLKAYKVNEYNDSSFIYQWLSLNQGIIYNQYRTPNIPHVVKNFTSIFSVFVPSLEEQQKIGSFFNAMDDRIEAQQTKIKQLQEMKNALLQRMFV